MTVIHGGKAKTDKIDSFKIAKLLRGGTFPVAYHSPKSMRAIRGLLRRGMKIIRHDAMLKANVCTRTEPEINWYECRNHHSLNSARCGLTDKCLATLFHRNGMQLNRQQLRLRKRSSICVCRKRNLKAILINEEDALASRLLVNH